MTPPVPIDAIAEGRWCDSLIADMDGTLVDSLPGIESSVLQAMAQCRVTPVISEFRSLVGPPIRQIVQQASGSIDPEVLDRLVAAYRTIYDSEGWRKSVLYPHAAETLQELRRAGLKLFVLTNKPRRPAQNILAHLEIEPLIDAFCTPDCRQPAYQSKAEALCYLQREWDLDQGRTLLVGDSLDDAQAAFTFGCKFAGVQFGYGSACTQREYPVHFKLISLVEINRILFNNPVSSSTF
jgi:phosphoglycolate phosphatase